MRARATINVGQNAPNWLLPLVEGDSVHLSDLKGSAVLLEFWFPNCGGCILAIPEINNIQDSYSHKGLKIYGIEFSKSNSDGLADYIKKRHIEYPTLHTGINVAKDYGVYAGPTIFLIDKKGLIVYASVGLNKEDLIKAISENI
jgi:peroxiredoxin